MIVKCLPLSCWALCHVMNEGKATNSLDPLQEGPGSSEVAKASGGSAQPRIRWAGALSNLPQRMPTSAGKKKQKVLKVHGEGEVSVEELCASFDACTDADLFAEKYVKQTSEDDDEDEGAAKLAAARNSLNFWLGQLDIFKFKGANCHLS